MKLIRFDWLKFFVFVQSSSNVFFQLVVIRNNYIPVNRRTCQTDKFRCLIWSSFKIEMLIKDKHFCLDRTEFIWICLVRCWERREIDRFEEETQSISLVSTEYLSEKLAVWCEPFCVLLVRYLFTSFCVSFLSLSMMMLMISLFFFCCLTSEMSQFCFVR